MELLGDVGHVESRSVRLEMVLVLTYDRCMVCAKRTIGQISFWTHPMQLLGDVGRVESRSVHLEMALVLTSDRCTVCAKHTIGSDIVFDTSDATTR